MIFHQSLVGDFTDFTQQNQQAPKSSNIDPKNGETSEDHLQSHPFLVSGDLSQRSPMILMMFNAISMRPVPTAGDVPKHFRIAARTSSFMPRFPGSDAVRRRAVGSLGHDRREWEASWLVTGQALFDLFGW